MLVKFFLLVNFLPAFAVAGEGFFSRAYTTETVPAKHFELEQTARYRQTRSFGSYQAADFLTEVEYGVTDDLQAAFYVKSGYMDARGAPDDNLPEGQTDTGFNAKSFFIESYAAEFIYRAMNPFTDPFGLAFYLEPEYVLHDLHNSRQEYNGFSNEMRILVQKNFFDDQLILAYNLVLEIEYYRYAGHSEPFQGELDWNNELGLTYRFFPNWYGGWEFRNHNETGNFWSHDHSVYWTGPVVHYGGQKVWATLGMLMQVYGTPTGVQDGQNLGEDHLFLHSHEKWELTAKLGIPF
jgi:hypothetical protein